jgi:hypothetical protein
LVPGVSVDDKEFEAEQDVRTLLNAEKIKGDKPRLKRAMAKAKEQMKALEKVRT